jgi:hypothetical protein
MSIENIRQNNREKSLQWCLEYKEKYGRWPTSDEGVKHWKSLFRHKRVRKI